MIKFKGIYLEELRYILAGMAGDGICSFIMFGDGSGHINLNSKTVFNFKYAPNVVYNNTPFFAEE